MRDEHNLELKNDNPIAMPRSIPMLTPNPIQYINLITSINMAVQPESILVSTNSILAKSRITLYPIENLLVKEKIEKIQSTVSIFVPINRKMLPPKAQLKSMKKNGALEITSNMQTCDILKDLDLIQTLILMKQLLAIVPNIVLH